MWNISNTNSDIKSQIVNVVNCIVKVHEKCGHHEIIQMKPATIAFDNTLLDPSSISDLASGQEDVVHVLSVHSGISAGVVASCDVGCNDRWESFILGIAVVEVGKATAKAGKKEIVLAPSTLNSLLNSMVLDNLVCIIDEDYAQLDIVRWSRSSYYSPHPSFNASPLIDDHVST